MVESIIGFNQGQHTTQLRPWTFNQIHTDLNEIIVKNYTWFIRQGVVIIQLIEENAKNITFLRKEEETLQDYGNCESPY